MKIYRGKQVLPFACALLLALGLVLMPGSGFVAAAAEATLSVSSASGGAGETVGVSVTIRGLDKLAGVAGISGGQFELSYDPAVASVESIKQGRAIGSDFLFLGNSAYTEKSIKVVWASESALVSADGDLCNIYFRLLKSGAVHPVIENLLLYDQDLNPIEITPRGNDTYVIGSGVSAQPPEPDDVNPLEQEGEEDPGEAIDGGEAPEENEPQEPAGQPPEQPAPTEPAPEESADREPETAMIVWADIWRNPLLYLALAVILIFLAALFLRRRAR